MRFRERDGDEVNCVGKDAYMPMYPKTTSQPSDDAGTAVRLNRRRQSLLTHIFLQSASYSFLPYSLDTSMRTSRLPYASGTYHDDSFAESPLEESAYCDRISEQGMSPFRTIIFFR